MVLSISSSSHSLTTDHNKQEYFSDKAKRYCRNIAVASGIGAIFTAIFSGCLLTSDHSSRREQGRGWANAFIVLESVVIVSLVAFGIFKIVSMMA